VTKSEQVQNKTFSCPSQAVGIYGNHLFLLMAKPVPTSTFLRLLSKFQENEDFGKV